MPRRASPQPPAREGFLLRTLDQLAEPTIGDAMARSNVERALTELDRLITEPAPTCCRTATHQPTGRPAAQEAQRKTTCQGPGR